MGFGKVVQLPFQAQPCLDQKNPSMQHDLFKIDRSGAVYFVFLNTEDLNQDLLLKILTMNDFNAVVDLRARPVFKSPNYNHKFVSEYIYKRSINYLELAMISGFIEQKSSSFSSKFRNCLDSAGKAAEGLVLGLIDQNSIKLGVVSEFRSALLSGNPRAIELHPRSIRGLPA